MNPFSLETHIAESLAALRRRFGPAATRRIEQMLDPAFRRTVPPLQRKSRFILPELSTGPWRDVGEFARTRELAASLEALHPKIKEEVHAALAMDGAAAPYSHYDLGDFDPAQWSSLYLFQDGQRSERTCRLCPITARLMTEVLGADLCPLQEMHFSIVEPGVHISPHADMGNFTLNLHLAVDIPDGCTIRVGDQTRRWIQGQCLLFDDSFEHEVWNRGKKSRICLLMDIWHPAVTPAEREGLVAVISAMQRALAEMA